MPPPLPPFGVHTLAELLADGVPAATVHSRVRRGQWVRLLPSVYATAEVSTLARCFAVVAWRRDAVLSHRTAAWLWGMHPEPATIEATVPRAVHLRAATSWLRVYRRNLDPSCVSTARLMPVVLPERALLDCIAVLPTDQAERMVDREVSRSVEPRTLRRRYWADLGMWGSALARDHISNAAPAAASEPERLLGRALSRAGLRTFVANKRVLTYICDFVDEAARVIVEVDGRQAHSTPEAFVRDRRRQNDLVRAGWLVLRYAASDIFRGVDAVVAEIRAVLNERSAPPRS